MKTSLTQTADLNLYIGLEGLPSDRLKRQHPSVAKLTSILALIVLVLCVALGSTAVHAAIDVYEFKTEQQEAQYRHLIDEFRCPKCQNQNLAGSDSQIAQDLKRKTYEMVLAGQSDAQIRDYMYDRYGAFISYKPPVRPSTWILWFFPPLILVLLISWWLWRNAHLNRTGQGVAVGAHPANPLHNSDSNSNSKNNVVAVNPPATDSATSGLSAQESAVLNDLLQSHQSDTFSHYNIDSGVSDSGNTKTHNP